jgi:hypothetical protein
MRHSNTTLSNDSTMSKTNTNINTNTNTNTNKFLSLPREIRQNILLHTLSNKDFSARIWYLRVDNGSFWGARDKWEVFFFDDEFKAWAKKLGEVHEVVRKDMKFVVKEWRKGAMVLMEKTKEGVGYQ